MTMVSGRSIFKRQTLLIALLIAVCNISCEKALQLKDPSVNANAVFEDLWKTIDRNYSLFPVKSVNWDSVYAAVEPQITTTTTDEQLFKILSATLAVLKDGHVSLISPSAVYVYEDFYKKFPLNFNFSNVKNTYLINQFKQKGPVIYKVVDQVGYLYYASFRDGISDSDLNVIFADLASSKGLILDVRGNKGGDVANAELLFRRFINNDRLIGYELKKNGPGHNDFGEMEALRLGPTSVYYNKPVMLLTNRSCFSTCNDFVMYMSYLPNVRLVGDQTGGGGAIPAEYLLVNGWKLRYSASVTLSPDKFPIENGILPDVAIGITVAEDLNGKDPILEKAYQLLQ